MPVEPSEWQQIWRCLGLRPSGMRCAQGHVVKAPSPRKITMPFTQDVRRKVQAIQCPPPLSGHRLSHGSHRSCPRAVCYEPKAASRIVQCNFFKAGRRKAVQIFLQTGRLLKVASSPRPQPGETPPLRLIEPAPVASRDPAPGGANIERLLSTTEPAPPSL